MRFATSFMTVCFVAFALGPQFDTSAALAAPGISANLANFLGKARIASGAPYRYHIVSKSRETHDGTTFDVTTESQGLRYLARSCAHGLCTGFYFDGERSYNTNFNDTALPLAASVDGLQVTLRAIASYAFTDPAFVANGGTLVERDAVLRDGKKYRRISVAPRFGSLMDAILDPASGLVVGVISDERKYAFEFSDQRRIGANVTLPFSISLNGYTFTKYDSRTVTRSTLAAPQGIVPAFAAGDVTVPIIASARGGAPVIACTIGGTAATCALDTSDSGLSMSTTFAKKLGLGGSRGAFDVKGSGSVVAGIAKGPQLAIGDVTYPSANYVVLNTIGKDGYDAILGADAFAHARITLDLARGQVLFAPLDPAASGGIPIAFDNFVPVIPIGLDGTTVSVQIDTGNDGAVELSRDYADRHPEIVAKGAASATIASVRVGSLELKNQSIDVREKIAGNGRIGSALLRNFAITFDYDKATIQLAAHS